MTIFIEKIILDISDQYNYYSGKETDHEFKIPPVCPHALRGKLA
jgi:hypothetical protein